MRSRWLSALMIVAGVVTIVAALGGGVGPGMLRTSALAQQSPQVAPNAPAPGNPQGPGGPGYGPGGPGYGPRFDPGYGPRFGPERFPRAGRGYGRGAGIVRGWFALNALLRFVLLIALLVIAWKVITSRSLWGRPDGAIQIVREQLARGDITEDEYRKRLAALS